MNSSYKMWSVIWVSCAAVLLGIVYMTFEYNAAKNIAIGKATSCEQAVLIDGGSRGADVNTKLMICKMGGAVPK